MTIENMELSGGARLSKQPCEDCGKYFVYYPQDLPGGGDPPPKRCPRCQDVRQARPSVVEERRELATYGPVVVGNLPGEWEEYSTGTEGDYPRYKIDIRGRRFGASWDGRIVIYAPRSVVPGEVVTIREMEATHRFREETVEVAHVQKSPHEPPTHTEIQPRPVTSIEGEEVLRKRCYLVLEPASDAEPKGKLVWATAYTKTTLKGFGRQFWAKVRGAPIVQWEISGGARSGRFHTTGILAIVDAEHPLVVETTGDIKEEKVYA
ncbi:MAG: hypothetical protein ABIG08_01240 [bacterium]